MKTKLALLLLIPFFLSNCSSPQEESEPYPADYMLAVAEKTAKKEKKNIFIMWHASWCGWCHRMDSLMQREDLKDYFNDNYVIEHMVVKERESLKHLENPGADSLLASYHADKVGIPFWVILDKKGQLLADAFIREEGVGMDEPGTNVGSPANPDEVEHFIRVLQQTSDIDAEGLELIKKAFTR